MLDDRRNLIGIFVFLLVGIVGVPFGIHQWILRAQSGWVCYSRHGHVLETVTACKTNLFAGLLLASAALAIGLYQAWRRL